MLFLWKGTQEKLMLTTNYKQLCLDMIVNDG